MASRGPESGRFSGFSALFRAGPRAKSPCAGAGGGVCGGQVLSLRAMNENNSIGAADARPAAAQGAGGIDVAHVCELAHFDFSTEERERFQKQLEPIAAYVRKLFEVDVEGVEPTQYGQPVANVFREDVPEPTLDRETVLANAPDASDSEFRMPKIVE